MASATVSESARPATDAPIRVVVADDSAAIRTLARYALSASRGFVVSEAADGVEALAVLDTFRPQCVVLDIEMPRMDGFEALAHLQRRSPDLPVILLSGRTDPGVADLARERGAVGYLDKSGSLTQLADAVRRATGAIVDDAPSASTGAAAKPAIAEPETPAEPPVATTTAAADLRRLEYVVSHDLGEPLRIMSGFSTILQSRYADQLEPTAQTFIGHIASAAARMQGMLDDLLAYSRAGRMEAKPQVVDLNGAVASVVESLQSELTARGATVGVDGLPAVLADSAMLHTVLRHVIVNALTFNTSSAPSVTVSGQARGRDVVVTITDNGIGIEPASTERVFELFARLNPREQYAGTGTGLALCRRLVGHLGGTITLDSEVGIGTTVTLTLPASTP